MFKGLAKKRTYMAGRNMFPAEKVKQQGAEAIHNTFRCYSSYRESWIKDIFR